VLALDFPGFAESPPAPPGVEVSIPYLADSVEAELDARGIGKAHFAGNSMGGWTALELARRGRALTATGISPAGLSNKAEQRRAVFHLYAAHYQSKLIPADRVAAIRPLWRIGGYRMFAKPLNLNPEEAAYSIRAIGNAPSLRSAERWMSRHEWEGFDTIECPVTILWGTKDRLIGVHQATRVKRLIPLAEVIEMPGMGHVPMADDPDRLAAAILRAAGRAPEPLDVDIDARDPF
jgi:pimeloyl-ACP methyl ester carboxylesterase